MSWCVVTTFALHVTEGLALQKITTCCCTSVQVKTVGRRHLRKKIDHAALLILQSICKSVLKERTT